VQDIAEDNTAITTEPGNPILQLRMVINFSAPYLVILKHIVSRNLAAEFLYYVELTILYLIDEVSLSQIILIQFIFLYRS